MDNKLELYRELAAEQKRVTDPNLAYGLKEQAWVRIDNLLDTISDLGQLSCTDLTVEEIEL